MHATPSTELTLSEPLTWAQICERYPDQWVALVEIDRIMEHRFEFRTARVAGAGKTRREPLVQARRQWGRYPEIGHYFTGRPAEPWGRCVPWVGPVFVEELGS